MKSQHSTTLSALSPRRPGEPVISLVTAAFNERDNLPALYHRICKVLDEAETPDWELIVVDDHSSDDTFDVVRALAGQDRRVRGVRLARNRGSHLAKLCGFRRIRGRCGIGLAADLQDAPEIIPQLLDRWRGGAQVVWGVRSVRPGESWSTRGISALYRLLIGVGLGIREVAAGGSSLVLMDERVVASLGRFEEQDPHYLGLIHWMGFRTAEVPFVQGKRLHGESKWTLGKKLALVRRSVLSFSPAPLRIIGWCGWGLALLATAGAVGAGLGHLSLLAQPLTVIVVLFVGGLQLIALGWIGEYLWNTLKEARARPLYLIEDAVGFESAPLEEE